MVMVYNMTKNRRTRDSKGEKGSEGKKLEREKIELVRRNTQAVIL